MIASYYTDLLFFNSYECKNIINGKKTINYDNFKYMDCINNNSKSSWKVSYISKVFFTFFKENNIHYTLKHSLEGSFGFIEIFNETINVEFLKDVIIIFKNNNIINDRQIFLLKEKFNVVEFENCITLKIKKNEKN